MGIDTIAFAVGIAPLLNRLRLLTVVRNGEARPPQIGRQIATIDRIPPPLPSGAPRLTINIISIRAGLRGTDMAMITKPFSLDGLASKILEMRTHHTDASEATDQSTASADRYRQSAVANHAASNRLKSGPSHPGTSTA